MKGVAPVVALALLLGGCATYRPLPLDPSPEVLAPPVANVLEARANSIKRAWLQPIEIDLSQPLTPDAVAALAVVNNPDLKAQRIRAGVADAQVFAAGLLPDPTISLGGSKVITGPDPFVDLASAVALDINALRTRGVTRAKAQADARQVRLDLAWAEWQTAGQARLQAAKVVAYDRLLPLAEASYTSARSLMERTVRAAARGDIAGDRVSATRVAATDAASKLRAAQSNLAAAREQLDQLLGLPPATPIRLASLPLPTSPPGTTALFALAEKNRTDLAALRAGYESQEAVVHKAILDQFPTLNLVLNNNRDSAGNFLSGAAVDFTLPLWNRNRGGIAVERATRAALKAEYEARLFKARGDIGAAVAGIELAFHQRTDALAGLAQIERFASASRAAATRGDVSLETAQNAEQALRDRQILIAQSEDDIMQQMIALELLTGTPREAWPQ